MSQPNRSRSTGQVSRNAGDSDTASACDFPFKNNAPDPLLSGKDLPTFKFALEKSQGRVLGGSFGKEATVEQLPISKGLAGVSMRLEPGITRELHWHATAAEWAFVVAGHCRTTVIDPDGNSETDDFEPGDIWYFPRGHGHSIACLGNEPCHFILIFDNGYFSEFGTFSITDWLGHTPKPLLAKNLGVPATALEGIPTQEAYFVRGPVPPEQPQPTLAGPLRPPALSHKYRMLADEPDTVHTGGREWRVGVERFAISQTMTGVLLELEPGGLRELHWHPTSDEWQYLLQGQVSVTLFGSKGRYRIEALEEGDVGYIPQGYGHSIENIGQTVARVLIAFNTGHYRAIDLSQWLAGNPAYLLAAHFGKPESLIAQLPRERVFIAPR